MNIWSEFTRITGGPGLSVGTVIAHSNGESVLTDAGGNSFRALGTSVAVGEKAYVENGKIAGGAPDLTNIGVLWV